MRYANAMATMPVPQGELTKVDGLICLQRARKYLLGFYGGQHDENDREAADRILLPLETNLLQELGLDPRFSTVPPAHGLPATDKL